MQITNKISSLQKFFAGLCLVFVFLPYLSLVGLHFTDIKPDSLILCSVFLIINLMFDPRFVKQISLNFGLIYFFLLPVYSLCIMYFSMDVNPRALGGYVGLFVFFYFGFFYQRLFKTFLPVLFWVIGVMFFFAAVQYFFDRNFGVIFFDRFRTSSNRGVTSLTNEPSFYGNLCLFYIFCLYLSWDKTWKVSRFWLICILLVIQILFLSGSVSTAMGLFIFVVAHLSIARGWKSIFGILCGIVAFFGLMKIYSQSFPLHRLAYVYQRFLQSPLDFFKIDQSIEQRFSDFFYTCLAFFTQFPRSFGLGLDSWISYQYFFVERLPNRSYEILITNSIKSGYGAALFQMGYMGAILPLFALWVFWRLPNWRSKVVGATLLVYMFTTVPLAFPPFGFLLGFAYAMHSKSVGD